MTRGASKSVLEILILNLKPGTRNKFHQLYINEVLPLLKKWKFQVVAHGPSAHDDTTYYVIRSFKSLAARQKAQDDYYGSDDWQKGPRTAILALVENYYPIVLSTEAFKKVANAL